MRTLATFAAVAIAALAPSAAHAERAAGITGNARLVTFDTLTPGTASVKAMTGFQAADERVVGLDLRPATGELMALTVPLGVASNATLRLYRVDANSASLTFIGSTPGTIASAADQATGIDFNPVADRLRVVQSNDGNFRINPANGAAITPADTNLNFTAPATGPITAVAYDRDVAGAAKTTLYGIDTGASRLVLQGGIDGSPSPNGGAITAVGSLGVAVLAGSDAGFDISPSGAAFATLSPSDGASDLYSVNLASGAATLVGPLPGAVTSLAILPPDNCPGVDGDNQADLDGDGIGDACDPDIDGDGISNSAEAAMGTNPIAADSDGDGKADGADSCPTLAAATANGCPNQPAAVAVDKTPPLVTVSGLAKKLKFAKFLKGVTAKVTPNEASSFVIELIARPRGATVSKAGDLVLASSSLGLGTGTRSVKLKPNRKLVGGRKKFTVTVRMTGTDANGNRSVVSKKVSITR